MIKKIALGLIAILAIILGLALTKPKTFTVERSIVIKATPEKILPFITDFHNWPTWSPWEQLDPNMQRTFTGASSGKGAIYSWKGNSDVGEGRMEIMEVVGPVKAVIKLDFTEPFAASSVTKFSMAPRDGQTTVTWSMAGDMHVVMKIMNVFTSMDSLMAPDMEKGLAKLKATAEVPANEPPAE